MRKRARTFAYVLFRNILTINNKSGIYPGAKLL